jgi:Rod binding domain-containing protein
LTRPDVPGISPDGTVGSKVLASGSAEKAAQAFEAAFLAEMLKHAGVGEAPEGFGGGAGEDQFAGFLREAQAREMAAAGGIGIAEYILNHLTEAADDTGT